MRLQLLICLVLLQTAVICHGQDVDPAVAKEIGDFFQQAFDSRPPPHKRAVFLKPHACARGIFTVASSLPDRLKQGLFATADAHTVWVRFSSDTTPRTSDFKNNTIGIGIKVLGVAGVPKILPGEENELTQDFLLQNHNVFFSPTAKDFLDFNRAAFAGEEAFNTYMKEHKQTDDILKAMDKQVDRVTNIDYGSCTPYHFGEKDFVKYKVVPCTKQAFEKLPDDQNKTNYLRERAERDLTANGACFLLQVQLKPESITDIDNASTEWKESESKPITVAMIQLPSQNIVTNDPRCEHMSFTPWHGLPAHMPAGSINGARAIVYKRMADLRRTKNGVPIAEPKD